MLQSPANKTAARWGARPGSVFASAAGLLADGAA